MKPVKSETRAPNQHHEIRVMRLAELKPAEYNPRTISKEAAAGLSASMSRFGLVDPLIVNKRTGYTIVGGHQRYAVMQHEGITEAQVVVVDLSEAEERALNVTLNNPHIAGDWSDDLAALLSQIQSDGAVDFEALALDKLLEELHLPLVGGNTDPDEVPPVPEKPITKVGDLWILGEHRLLCGDATKLEDVTRLMDGKKAEMVFTDPPYNLGFKYNSYEDNKSPADYRSFCDIWFENLKQVAAQIIVTPGTRNLAMWCQIEPPLHVGCWVKKNWISGCSVAHLQQWEPILFYGKFANKRASDLYEINRVFQEDVGDDHPCPKQVALIADIFKSYAKESILDIFGGSGTSMIAAEQLKMKAHLLELDPRYCDVIVKRWENFVGKKAVRKSA